MRLLAAALVLVFACGLPAWSQTSGNAPFEDRPIDEAVAAYNRKDYATALKQLPALAAKGDADAQYHLGMIYLQGHGVRADDKEAVAWIRKSAEQGFAPAQRQLGLIYYTGGINGIDQSDAQAAVWFGKVRAQGLVDAIDLVQIGQSYLMTYVGEGKYTKTEVWVKDVTGKASYTEYSELDAEHNCKLSDAGVLQFSYTLRFQDADDLRSSSGLNVALNMNGNKTSYDLPLYPASDVIFLNSPEFEKFRQYMYGVLAGSKKGRGAKADRRQQELEKRSSLSFNFTTKHGLLSFEFPLDGMGAAHLRKVNIDGNMCQSAPALKAP